MKLSRILIVLLILILAVPLFFALAMKRVPPMTIGVKQTNLMLLARPVDADKPSHLIGHDQPSPWAGPPRCRSTPVRAL